MANKHPDTPTDPIELEQYYAWRIKRYAAKRENILWDITFTQFKNTWKDNWHRHGNSSDCLFFQRVNNKLPWTISNIELKPKRSSRRKHEDPTTHKQFKQWMRMKAQATFRNDEWNLSFEDFVKIWTPVYHLRGRGSNDYCLTRKDPKLPWDKDNTVTMQRNEQIRIANCRHIKPTMTIQEQLLAKGVK